MKTKLLALVALLTLLLTGCANQYFRVSPVLDHPKEDSDTGNRSAYKRPINLDTSPYIDWYKAKDQTNRNLLQNKIIELSDDICEQHKGDIIGTSATVNLTTGLGATVFSGVSAIVTGAAATNYAAGATILNGTRSAVSAEVYQGLFTTAIIKAIEESRDKKKNEILVRQTKNISEYTMDQAVIDAQDYHFRCSFYHGLVVLNEDAKKRATPGKDELLGRIEILRKEITLNNEQKSLNGTAVKSDMTNIKLQQAIDAIYDRLNTIDQ